MTTCERCGTPVRGRRLCDPCSIEVREDHTTGGEAGSEPDPVTVRCTADGCDCVYEYPTSETCPKCSARRRRAVPGEEDLRADGGGYERVIFEEGYDGMSDELNQLVGDSGFIVPASEIVPYENRVLVQFDKNKTGRPGGERHWIPKSHLKPEPAGGDGGES